jgi:hypothetical protein
MICQVIKLSVIVIHFLIKQKQKKTSTKNV